MKKAIVIGLVVLICVSTYTSVIAIKNIYVEVFQPDYTVMVDGTVLNDNTKYPLLEHNGETYISLHDYADMWGGSVRWDEERQIPSFSVKGYDPFYYSGDFIFDDVDSALEIGKALAEEKFVSQISEKTKYSVMEITLSGAFAYYSIYLYLDGSQITEEQLDDWGYGMSNADLEIRYFIRSGEIYFFERHGEEWEKLFVEE